MIQRPDQTGTIYFIAPVGGGPIKIGITQNLALRFRGLMGGSPVPLEILATAPGTMWDEWEIHARYAADRLRFEWFEPTAQLLAVISAIKDSGRLPEGLKGHRYRSNPFNGKRAPQSAPGVN